MYIILAILAFGIIIAVHELGHFFAAKAMNVKVNEMAIGMGPKLFSKQGKETLYSLRLVPFGGYCNMEGEYGEKLEEEVAEDDGFIHEDHTHDEYTPSKLDPRSFTAQKRWRRVVILAAGSFTNFVAAFIIVAILSIGADGYGSTTLVDVVDRLPEQGQSELMDGDTIVRINGERLYYYNDYAMFMNLNAGNPITLTLSRGGELFEYHSRTYTVDGEPMYRYTLNFEVIEPSFWENMKFAGYQTFNFVRMIRISISMMLEGTASVREVSGPIGVVSVMNTVGQESSTIIEGILNILYLTAFIGVNVAVLNMLPIPAMDGGRILFTFISWVIEKITNKPLDPKYENYINTGAFMLLIGLMIIIMFNDIMRIIG